MTLHYISWSSTCLWTLRRVQIYCTCIHIQQGQALPRAYYFHGWPRSKWVQAKSHKNQNYSEFMEQIKSKLYPQSVQKKCVLYPQGIWRNGWMKKILSTKTNTWTQKDALRIYYIYIFHDTMTQYVNCVICVNKLNLEQF